jgi:23S rRNA (guanosine2251-2'-O)-methyltransferase
MFEVQHIRSFVLPELAAYRTMKFQGEHRAEGIFVAESEKTVRRLLQSELGVVSIVLPETMLAEFEEALNKRPEVIRIYCAPKNVLEQLTGFQMYQGVMAVGKVPRQPSLESLLNAERSRKEIEEGKCKMDNVLIVAADGIANSHNVGVLVRNCAAFSATAILTGENSCSPWIRRAVAASVGTIFKLPAIELTDLCGTLKELKKRGIWCVAAHPHTDKRMISQANFRRDVCVVFGAEGEGVRPAILELCDEIVAIPMATGVDSLNVGSASAAFLYEVARQRGFSHG